MVKETWIIVGIAILVLAPLYGHWIGALGKTRSWNAGRLGQLLWVPLIVAVFGVIEAPDIPQAPRWVRIAVPAGTLSYVFLTAFYAAARSSGFPIRTLLFSRGDAGGGLNGNRDLSIR